MNSFCTNYPSYWFCTTSWSIESTTQLHNDIICDIFIKINILYSMSSLGSNRNARKKQNKTKQNILYKFYKWLHFNRMKYQVCYDSNDKLLLIMRVLFIPINNYVQLPQQLIWHFLYVVFQNIQILQQLLNIQTVICTIKAIRTHQFGVFLK